MERQNLFTKLDFYEAPILLEEVDDTEILGCTISTTQRTITVRQPKDLVSLRLSEDSDLAVISAFRARALLIIRYTFPIPLIFDQLTDLIAIFGLKSVTPEQLRCTQRTLCSSNNESHQLEQTSENMVNACGRFLTFQLGRDNRISITDAGTPLWHSGYRRLTFLVQMKDGKLPYSCLRSATLPHRIGVCLIPRGPRASVSCWICS